ncbi:MAG: hypothetical protein ABI615_06250 [Chthoniobacterales bacterium]
MPNAPKELFFRSLNRELIRRGIWGATTQQINQDLLDHLESEIENQLSDDCDTAKAQTIAVQRLGTPEDIAQAVSQQKRTANWFGRHLGLTSAFILLFGFGIQIANFIFQSILLNRVWSGLRDSQKIETFQAVCSSQLTGDFLSIGRSLWLLGILSILWLSIRAPFGWRGLLITTTSIIFAMGGMTLVVWPFLESVSIAPVNSAIPLSSHIYNIGKAWLWYGSLWTIPWIVRFWHFRIFEKQCRPL